MPVAPEDRFYKVSFSYSSVKQDYVQEVVRFLTELLPEGGDAIFFDRSSFHQGKKRANLDLRKIYGEQSEYIVPIHCEKYNKPKSWAWEVEHPSILAMDKKGLSDSIIPVRFDKTEIEGFEDTDIYINIYQESGDSHVHSKKIAQKIFARMNEGKPPRRLYHLNHLVELWGAKYLEIRRLLSKENISNNLLREIAKKVVQPYQFDFYPENEDESYSSVIDWVAEVGKRKPDILLKYLASLINRQKFPKKKSEKIEDWLKYHCLKKGINRTELVKPVINNNDLTGSIYILVEFTDTDDDDVFHIKLSKSYSNNNSEGVIFPINAVNFKTEKSKVSFITELVNTINDIEEEETKKVHIEYIVPFHLLWCDFEHWTENDGEAIGHQYPLCVRSQERVNTLRKKIRGRWKKIEKTQDINDQMMFLERCFTSEASVKQFAYKAQHDDTCRVVICESQQEIKSPNIELLIKHGLPIIIWVRKKTRSIFSLTETTLTPNFLDKCGIMNNNISHFYKEVKSIRVSGIDGEEGEGKQGKYIRNNLVFLMDDKDRLPHDHLLVSSANEE